MSYCPPASAVVSSDEPYRAGLTLSPKEERMLGTLSSEFVTTPMTILSTPWTELCLRDLMAGTRLD